MSSDIRMVAPSEIRMPSNYVRGPKGFNEEWAKELATIAAQSAGWPFEPLEVFKVTGDKSGRLYEVNNGAHRLWAAVKNKVKSIPVVVRTFESPADAYAAQLVATMKSGTLKLDLDARDAAIRQLALHFNVDRKKIMVLSGLSDASVSRILAAKQRVGETGRRKGKKKARKASRSGAGGPRAFAPLDWYTGLGALVDSFRKHAQSIIRARVEVQPRLLADGFVVASAVVSGEVPPASWIKPEAQADTAPAAV